MSHMSRPQLGQQAGGVMEAAIARSHSDREGVVAKRDRVSDFLMKGVSDVRGAAEEFRRDKIKITPGQRILAWGAAAVPFLIAPIPAAIALGAVMYMRQTKSKGMDWGDAITKPSKNIVGFIEKGVNALFQTVHNDADVEKMPVAPTSRLIAAGVLTGSFLFAPITTAAVVATTGVLTYTKKASAAEIEAEAHESAEKAAGRRAKIKDGAPRL